MAQWLYALRDVPAWAAVEALNEHVATEPRRRPTPAGIAEAAKGKRAAADAIVDLRALGIEPGRRSEPEPARPPLTEEQMEGRRAAVAEAMAWVKSRREA